MNRYSWALVHRSVTLSGIGFGFELWVWTPDASANRCGSSATDTSQNCLARDRLISTISSRLRSLRCPLRSQRHSPLNDGKLFPLWFFDFVGFSEIVAPSRAARQ